MAYMSPAQREYLHFVREHPGCCVADVDRACRYNPQAGHKWVYDGVSRLVRRCVLVAVKDGARKRLYVA